MRQNSASARARRPGIAAEKGHKLGVLAPLRKPQRILRLDLAAQATLPRGMRDLDQPLVSNSLQAARLGKCGSRLATSRKRAREDAIDRGRAECASKCECLLLSDIRKLRLALTLVAPLAVPSRLAMARDVEDHR